MFSRSFKAFRFCSYLVSQSSFSLVILSTCCAVSSTISYRQVFNFSSKIRYESSLTFYCSSIFRFKNSTYCFSKAYSLPDSSFSYIASSCTIVSFFRVASNFSPICVFSFSNCSLVYFSSSYLLVNVSFARSTLWVIVAIVLSFSRQSAIKRSILEASSTL